MNELGAFLRTRRARLTPAAAGLVSYGPRRVPGLRREELAQLAGVSPTYYMRLEQGQSRNASTSVIDALARALRLTPDERTHLFNLARPPFAPSSPPAVAHLSSPDAAHLSPPAAHLSPPAAAYLSPPAAHLSSPDAAHLSPASSARAALSPVGVARPTMLRLLAGMPDVPAVLVDRRTSVLAWNPLGHALLAFHEPTPDINLTRLLFLDPRTRNLYRDWHIEACRAVASLRLVAGRHPTDRALAELIGYLCIHSPDFADIWSHHPIAECVTGRKLLHHPLLGDLDLDFEVLQSADNTGQRLITYPAEPGTPAATALSLLSSMSNPPALQPSAPPAD
ncbi:helix-turn-helix domain-containing protein [Actinoplanes sp. NPDC049596]|uniref:helix-turn-helix transcriptional regulator n=1 Tax=unclassified Actinoplanes TaxID=2626549 RepID=UPI003420CD98